MSLSFNDYQLAARETAIYPNLGENPSYPTHGLAGEAGELMEKIGEVVYLGVFNEYLQQGIKKEIGDLFWYSASVCSEFGLSLAAYEGLLDVQFDPTADLHFDAAQPNTLKTAIQIPIAVGKICEIVKKIERDKGGKWDSGDQTKIHDAMFRVIENLTEICKIYGLKPRDVAQANLDKLASRKQRGVLQGSGDNR